MESGRMLLMLLTLTGSTSAQPEQYRAVVSLLCVFKRDVKIYIYIHVYTKSNIYFIGL